MLDTKQKKALIDAAIQARKSSYSPYSSYRVGAALLTENGEVVPSRRVVNLNQARFMPTFAYA